MARNDQRSITAGVIDRAGEFFVLFEDEECIDDECILGHARRAADRLILTELTEPEEVVSMLALPDEWGDHAVALLGAAGEFTLASVGSTETGSIHRSKKSPRLGRMTRLRHQGDVIYAMGYGGQVHRRTATSGWTAMPVGEKGTKSPACLYTVAQTEDGEVLYFGGTTKHPFRRTEEMSAAKDGRELARLILAAKRKSQMAIFRFEDGWSEIDFGSDGLISEFLPAPDGGWYIFASRGVVRHTHDFQTFEEVIELADKQSFFDMKLVGREVFVMIGQALHRMVARSLVEFSPQLPGLETGYTNFTSFGEQLAAVHPEGIMLFEDGAWVDLRLG